jgi:Protein of unknown function (DUF3096)
LQVLATSPRKTGRGTKQGTLAPSLRYRLSQVEHSMVIGIAHLQPIVALIAGVLILVMPRLLNYIVAIYLIFIGLLGLGVVR